MRVKLKFTFRLSHISPLSVLALVLDHYLMALLLLHNLVPFSNWGCICIGLCTMHPLVESEIYWMFVLCDVFRNPELGLMKSEPQNLFSWPVWADSVRGGAYGSRCCEVSGVVCVWGGACFILGKPRIKHAWSKAGGWRTEDMRGVQMYSSAIKCMGLVCMSNRCDF